MAGMNTSSDDSRRSGSRWEPASDEQPTQVLGAAAPVPPKNPRRVPTGMVVTAAAVLSGLLGAGAGYAVASSKTAERPASTVQEQAPGPQSTPPYGAPGFADGRHEGFDDDHDEGFR
jgi:hypothetical protein